MADEQTKPSVTVPQPIAAQVSDAAQPAANVTPVAQAIVQNIKTHIAQAVAAAALKAGEEVRAEEQRLKALGAKVAGPFGRIGRAVRAGVVAFLATWHAQA